MLKEKKCKIRNGKTTNKMVQFTYPYESYNLFIYFNSRSPHNLNCFLEYFTHICLCSTALALTLTLCMFGLEFTNLI